MSKPTQSTPSDSTKYLTAAAAGVVFGFALEKGHVFSPETIVRQFLMQDFTMLKMFLSAAATSMFVHSALSCTHSGAVPVDLLLNRKSDRGVLTTALGAAILGSGMALAGSCPGTVWVQLGAGESNALLVFFSGLLGATCYAFADRLGLFRGISTAIVPKEDKVNKTLGVSYAASATVVASALIALIAFFEYAFPSHLPLLPHSLADVKWSPITAGIIVGCLQLPMLLFAHRAIGASSSFIAVSANAIAAVAPDVVKNTKALADAKDGASNWIQPVYVSAAALGSYLAARLSNTVGVPSGLSLSHTSAALGGFLLLFGARVANGCTSGHGISGFSLLGLRSISATAAMFGGAIATAVVLRALHQYPAGF